MTAACPCEEAFGAPHEARLRAICDGTSGLPDERRRKYLALWREEGRVPAEFVDGLIGPPPAPSPEPPLPSLTRQAMNYAKAEARHTANGRRKAPPELLAARLAVCQGTDETPRCPSYRPSDKRCAHRRCGCFVELKGTYLSERCPEDRWPKAEPTQASIAAPGRPAPSPRRRTGRTRRRKGRPTSRRPAPPPGPPEFVTLETLTRDTLSLVPKLPPDISVVVGVARSGMAPASLLAMHLHKPLYAMTKDGIVDCGHGWRLGTGKPHGADVTSGTALIVDDTVMLGGSLTHARNIAAPHFPKRLHANVYVNPAAKVRPDVFARYLPAPHLLEWNFFNSLYLSYAAFDFDGIFCRDFTPQEDDDGPGYLAAMEAMAPSAYLPRKAPVHIITARLDRYREPTLAWLARWGVQVASLTMGPWKTKVERQRSSVAAWKAGEVKRLFATIRPSRKFGGPLFVESCPRQAEEIARLSGYLTVSPPAARSFR